MKIAFSLNDRPMCVDIPSDRKVVDLLREDLGLTGTKEGCGAGECGACTILVDGESRLSCLMLAVQLQGRRVTTIEGLAPLKDGGMHPVQEAFVEYGAVQCGFCTPGMILSAVDFLGRNPHPTRTEIREALSGNLCRCTGYVKIVDAVEAAARKPDSQEENGRSVQAERDTGEAPSPAAVEMVSLRTRAKTLSRNVPYPKSLSEFWECLESMPHASVYAGGTDLLVKMRGGLVNPSSLICLERIEELRDISERGSSLRIGSCTSHARLLEDRRVRESFPMLVTALKGLGSPLIRNMGTLGGNICTASPAGDTLPPLVILGAQLELCSRNDTRRMPLADFITGPGRTCLRAGEILSAVWIDKPQGRVVQHFEKVGQRNALTCSVASLAALLRFSPGGVVQDAALAWGSVGPTVMRCPEAEALLLGERLTLKRLEEAAETARRAVSPICDVRADADYRRMVVGNLLLRLILTEWENT